MSERYGVDRTGKITPYQPQLDQAGIQQRWNPELDFDLTYYLSGPMTGYDEYNYPAFEAACQTLRATGISIESPHENPAPPTRDAMTEAEIWSYYMEVCYKQMDKCQGIILMKGWPQSTGARQELEIAMQKEWPVWYYHNFQLTNMNRSK
jgi:hypothetical protein